MTTNWIKPTPEIPGLSRYIKLVRTRLWLVWAIAAISLGAAAGYIVRADKVYQAGVDMLVNPVPEDSPEAGLGLLRESADPTRDVSTAAVLVRIPAVAQRVRTELKIQKSSRLLLNDVTVEPVAKSSIVNVSVKARAPADARNLANAFGNAAIAERTFRMHQAIDKQLPGLRASVESLPGDERAGSAVNAKLQRFLELRAGSDPTLRVEVPASLPTEAISPKPVLSIIIALIGGLVLGLGAVFALQMLDPRLRREDQLSERFSLPILAAIPKQGQPRNEPSRTQLSTGGGEGYSSLRAALRASRRITTPNGRTVMITGPSRGDGKTTTALNLAAALAHGREDVILIDADWRRPAVGGALDLNNGLDLHAGMQNELSLEQALVTVGAGGTALRVLPTMPGSVAAEVALSSPDAESLLLRATSLSDWVVVDAPPLNHVPDLLGLARQVDDVVLVVHLGRTDLRELDQLTQMLTQHDVTPAGFVVIGATRGHY